MSSLEEYYKGLDANASNPAYILHLEVKDAIDKINELSMDKIEGPVEAASHIYEIVRLLCSVVQCSGVVVETTDPAFRYHCRDLAINAREDVRELLDAIHRGTIPVR